jgi:hypothetical protein
LVGGEDEGVPLAGNCRKSEFEFESKSRDGEGDATYKSE